MGLYAVFSRCVDYGCGGLWGVVWGWRGVVSEEAGGAAGGEELAFLGQDGEFVFSLRVFERGGNGQVVDGWQCLLLRELGRELGMDKEGIGVH